jgi:hypothetical protein
MYASVSLSLAIMEINKEKLPQKPISCRKQEDLFRTSLTLPQAARLSLEIPLLFRKQQAFN